MKVETSSRRRYRMKARADATAATGERILDAAMQLFWERPTVDISLDAVAQQAGVSTQTVIRRFGSKEALLAATAERETKRVAAQRDQASPGDLPGAVKVLIDHYEETGDRVLKLLAEEEMVPALRPLVDRGRRMHRDWCERVLARNLEGRCGTDRRRLLAQLIAVCDVYTWKLLRRDSRLGRAQTELAVLELLNGLLGDA
jgi:AcrR family transcriptional regulator